MDAAQKSSARNFLGRCGMKTKLHRPIASLLIVSISACAGTNKLARDEQLALSSQPKIHAVHHRPAAAFAAREPITTALPLDTRAEPTVSESTRPQREQPEDPAPRVKSRLVGALQANLKLTNVDTVSDPLQNDDVKTLKDVFKTGVVLDVRTMKWAGDDYRGNYLVRARMVRLEDSTVLWKTTCNARWAYDGNLLGAQLRKAADDCAAQLSAKALGKDHKPVSVTGHTIPAEGLPSVPRIVVDEQSIDLPGLEMTPEERALFEDERSARIDRRAEVSLSAGDKAKGIALCIVPPLCAVVWAVAGTIMGVHWGIKRAIVSAREPSLIPEQDSARLAAMLKEQATGASLAERIVRLPGFPPASAATEVQLPRLVVRVKVAQPDYSRRHVGVSIVAQAQAFPSTGAEWGPTEHRYEFSSLAWTANDAELVRREIDEAVDALADSIWSAYSPRLPDGTVKELRKPVEATGPVLEDVRQLAHQTVATRRP
jgi:hypothetical protein